MKGLIDMRVSNCKRIEIYSCLAGVLGMIIDLVVLKRGVQI